MDETSFKMVYELKAVLETNYDIVIDAHNVEVLKRSVIIRTDETGLSS